MGALRSLEAPEEVLGNFGRILNRSSEATETKGDAKHSQCNRICVCGGGCDGAVAGAGGAEQLCPQRWIHWYGDQPAREDQLERERDHGGDYGYGGRAVSRDQRRRDDRDRDACRIRHDSALPSGRERLHGGALREAFDANKRSLRSEEHTSELQSRQYLVC